MPQLSALAVSVALGQQPLAAAMAISSISSRLPQLRYLGVYSTDSLVSAQQVWDSLGTATQLTALNIQFASGVRTGCTVRNLLPLGSLTGLQQLIIGERWGRQQQEGGGSFAFLGALTALTFLDIAIPSTTGLSSISSCTALQALRLCSAPRLAPGNNAWRLPGATEWQAIGQLTQLTELCGGAVSADPPQPFYAALAKLTRLQTVVAARWTPAAVPVLVGLPQLRCVGGHWWSGGDGLGVGGAGGAVCHGVTCLASVGGFVDFRAFPDLEFVSPTAALTAAAWQSMASCCPKLRDVCGPTDPSSGMLIVHLQASYKASVVAEGLAAVRSLSQLTALTRLSFTAVNNLDVSVLADALPSLRELHIVAVPELDCRYLTPLAKLTSLTALCCYLEARPAHPAHVQVLLSALSQLPLVVVAGAADTAAFVRRAVAAAYAAGLRLPGRLRVQQLASVS